MKNLNKKQKAIVYAYLTLFTTAIVYAAYNMAIILYNL